MVILGFVDIRAYFKHSLTVKAKPCAESEVVHLICNLFVMCFLRFRIFSKGNTILHGKMHALMFGELFGNLSQSVISRKLTM